RRTTIVCHTSLCSSALTPSSTLSLPDALPILSLLNSNSQELLRVGDGIDPFHDIAPSNLRFMQYWAEQATASDQLNYLIYSPERSEEHTSELQSRENLIYRLLLQKKTLLTTSH